MLIGYAYTHQNHVSISTDMLIELPAWNKITSCIFDNSPVDKVLDLIEDRYVSDHHLMNKIE